MATCNETCGVVKAAESCVTNEEIALPDIELPVPNDNDKITIPSVGEVTTEEVDGTGVFDVYMRAGLNQLTTQYDEGRIKGSDFAQAYTAQVELMMTEANKFVLGVVQAEIAAKMFQYEYIAAQYSAVAAMHATLKSKAEADLICQQAAELKANGTQERTLKAAQTTAQCKTVDLYDRQIVGFDDKRDADAFSSIMQAWAIQGSEISADPGASVLNTLKYKWMEEINAQGTGGEAASVTTGGILGKMMDQTKLNSTGEPK